MNSLGIKLGEIYGQLEMLVIYANECNAKLEQWSEPILNTYNLNTELEKLRELNSKGWN